MRACLAGVLVLVTLLLVSGCAQTPEPEALRTYHRMIGYNDNSTPAEPGSAWFGRWGTNSESGYHSK